MQNQWRHRSNDECCICCIKILTIVNYQCQTKARVHITRINISILKYLLLKNQPATKILKGSSTGIYTWKERIFAEGVVLGVQKSFTYFKPFISRKLLPVKISSRENLFLWESGCIVCIIAYIDVLIYFIFWLILARFWVNSWFCLFLIFLIIYLFTVWIV